MKDETKVGLSWYCGTLKNVPEKINVLCLRALFMGSLISQFFSLYSGSARNERRNFFYQYMSANQIAE